MLVLLSDSELATTLTEFRAIATPAKTEFGKPEAATVSANLYIGACSA